MLCKVFIFAKSLVCTFSSSGLVFLHSYPWRENFFKKILLSCCRIYTKRFTFVNRKQVRERIIWFYLVRAEVVLWWHCLIFFVRGKCIISRQIPCFSRALILVLSQNNSFLRHSSLWICTFAVHFNRQIHE